MPSRPVMPCTITRFVGSISIAMLTIQTLNRQRDASAAIAQEITFDFTRQTFDAAATFSFFAAYVEYRHISFQRQNFRHTGFNADFRSTVAAPGMIVSDCAACDRFERIGFYRGESFTYQNIFQRNI